jgi:hypothetical protein
MNAASRTNHFQLHEQSFAEKQDPPIERRDVLTSMLVIIVWGDRGWELGGGSSV